jgi:pseudaminic acid synthase
MMTIKIGKHILGEGNPTFIVAEMSGNHGGSLEKAIEIVHAAKRAGADAIKLQTYTADTITLHSDKEDFTILSDNPWSSHSTLWDLYNVAHTPWEWHEAIFKEARALDMEIFSSPFDETAVDLLEKLNAPAYKIASPEITNIPLLEKVAATGKPVVISTGISDLTDIELALATLRTAGATEIIVLKCTTSYPAPPAESNLLTIPDIIKRFGVLSGLSDHSMGTAAAIATVALGGSLIEKHFTLEGGDETVDSFFSSGEAEFTHMVNDIRFIDAALGTVNYDVTPSALPSLRGRSSLYVAGSIKAGEKFTPANIKSVRPSFGLHPKHYKEIIGRSAKKDLELGDRLSWEVIE